MKHLCVNCDYIDGKSAEKWAKAYEASLSVSDIAMEHEEPAYVQFDTWKPHCTHEKHKRQPVTDAVAGTHLDGPPYLTCREVRKTYPVTCPFFEERKNADN